MSYPPVNPQDLMIAQALFGQALQGNQKALDLINTFGPLLMASILFSMCQDWAPNPDDPDDYQPRRTLEDARDQAHAIVDAVYAGHDLMADAETEVQAPGTEPPV